jgi:transcription elongation factor Elf1
MNDENDSTIICPFCNAEQAPGHCLLGCWGNNYACRCRYCGGAFTFPATDEDSNDAV